jgi:hypothetical protein
MNRKQFVLLLVVVAVLGGAGLLLRNRSESDWHSSDQSVGKKLLGEFQINDVAHIALKQGTNEVNLAKKDDLWRVRERDGYPAAFPQISDFLLKVRDLKAVQSEPVGASQLARLELAPGQGTNSPLVVEFKDQSDKTIRSLLLGKKHMKKSNRPSPPMGMGDEMGGDNGFPDGRWVKTSADAPNALVISDPLESIHPTADQWLNKDFVHIEKIRAVTVTYPANATNSFKLTRENQNAEWKLDGAKTNEVVDAGKCSPMNSCSPNFADVTSAKPEQLGLDKPTVVTVETFDDFTYNIKVGAKTNDNYPITLTVSAQFPKERATAKDEKPDEKAKLDKAFVEDQKKLQDRLTQEKAYEKWTYLVMGYSLDSILKERGQLLQEKKEEPKKDDKPPGTATIEPPKPAEPVPPLAAPGPLVPPPDSNAAPKH